MIQPSLDRYSKKPALIKQNKTKTNLVTGVNISSNNSAIVYVFQMEMPRDRIDRVTRLKSRYGRE